MLVFVARQDNPARSEGGPGNPTLSLVVPAGTELPAVLERPVISSTAGTPVAAVVTSDDPLPAGTKFLGTGRTDYSTLRIMVDFSQAVLPDGRSARVSASALAHDGLAGLVGEVDNKTGHRLLMALGFSAIQGVAAAQRAFTIGPFGTTTLDPSDAGRNTALETAAGMASDQARQQYSEAQRATPTITVPRGAVVSVLVQAPMEMKQ
ncbi:MAG: TrbI/VirB10 family protein [Nitrospinota bacterium]